MTSLSYSLLWILIIEIFSILTYPAISLIFKGISDKGFAISKILGILIASYLVWILGSIHFIEFTRLNTIIFSVVVFIFAIGVTILGVKYRALDTKNNFLSKLLKPFAREEHLSIKQITKLNTIIIVEEIVFLASFFIWVYIRGINPNIMGTEKFMDFGILNAILKSNYFPPHDMWLSGFSLNYYYYGQYIFAFLTKLSAIGSNYTYNFAIATIFSFVITLTISLVHTLTRKITPAILSGLILTIAGNIHFVLSILEFLTIHGNLNGFSYWYPTATRLIPYTINEFPVYSFIVSDLHAHVTDIPIVLISLLISLNILLKKSFNILDLLLSAFILGITAITNSWDAAFYASVLFIVLLYLYVIDARSADDLSFKDKIVAAKNRIKNIKLESVVDFLNLPIFQAIFSTLTVGILAILLYLPFYLHFKAPVDGVGINKMAHSSISLEVVLFGFFFFFITSFVVYLFYAIISKKKFHITDIFVIYLIFLGIMMLLVPEIIFLKDIFYKANPPYFRANTVFKLYYAAWILFSIAVGYIFSRINGLFKLKDIGSYTKYIVVIWDIFVGVLLLSVFGYSYEAINQGYFNIQTGTNATAGSPEACIANTCFATFKTEDGTQYIKDQYPQDFAMISWLNDNAANDSILAEAVGDSYTYAARISANTGLQSVLGWPNHEYQWRNTYAYSSARTTDLFSLYNAGTPSQAQGIINKYKINYIIVGNFERTQYPSINEKVLKQTGQIVFSSANSYIIKTSV